MSKYNETLDESVKQMQTICEAMDAAYGVLGDIHTSLVAEIHRQEQGNIKQPLHVLHWRTGLRALRSLDETKGELVEAIKIYTKNR